MTKSTLILTFCILAILSPLTNINSQDHKRDSAVYRINEFLNEGIQNGFSGAVFIAKKGHVILNQGYGLADRENSIPYLPETVSSIGSVTKQFTATAILKLEELGKLRVENSISLYFNRLPADKKDITIHQLLTHSSGLKDVVGGGDFEYISTKKFFKTVFSSELLHKPGTKYAYSNLGYSILARIIELTSGLDYESYLNEYLFKPAGMSKTGYLLPSWKKNTIAKGYVNGIKYVGSMMELYEGMDKITWSLKGNGGIHSTTLDMYKWYIALKSSSIISTSSFEKLVNEYIKEDEKGNSHYGYGWAIYKSKQGKKIISHNGGNKIYFHDFIWNLDDDILIILFTNGGSKEMEVAWDIKNIISDSSYTPQPIRKDLYLVVNEFITINQVERFSELRAILKKEYKISNPTTLNGLGYYLLRSESKNSLKWAIEIFKFNVELFPSDGNIWDSLGEAFLLSGQNEQAYECYSEALKLAKEKDCAWCNSSRRALKKLSRN